MTNPSPRPARKPTRRTLAREAYEDHLERERQEAVRQATVGGWVLSSERLTKLQDAEEDRRRITRLVTRLDVEWLALDDASIMRISNTVKTIARKHCHNQAPRLTEGPSSRNAESLGRLVETWRLLRKGRASWMDLWLAADTVALLHGGDDEPLPLCGDPGFDD